MSGGVIYQIKNIKNGKRYIGSTKDRKGRWRKHKGSLKNNEHHNPHLQNAWNKYGEKAFEFSVIETIQNQGNLFDREQYYLDKEDPEYNIRPQADRSKLAESTKRKISESLPDRSGENNPMYDVHMKGEDAPMYGKKGAENPMYGKHHTEEAREKISKAKRENHRDVSGENNPMYGRTGEDHPMYGKNHTRETKEKMSKNHVDVRGERNPNSKLTKKKVKVIKHLINGDSFMYKEIGNMFGVSGKTIGGIAVGNSWSHVEVKNYHKEVV